MPVPSIDAWKLRGKAPYILNLDTECRYVDSFTLRPMRSGDWLGHSEGNRTQRLGIELRSPIL